MTSWQWKRFRIIGSFSGNSPKNACDAQLQLLVSLLNKITLLGCRELNINVTYLTTTRHTKEWIYLGVPWVYSPWSLYVKWSKGPIRKSMVSHTRINHEWLMCAYDATTSHSVNGIPPPFNGIACNIIVLFQPNCRFANHVLHKNSCSHFCFFFQKQYRKKKN